MSMAWPSVSSKRLGPVTVQRYMRAFRGRHVGYTQIDYTFSACKYCEVCRQHVQHACGKLTPAWPTEVFVLQANLGVLLA